MTFLKLMKRFEGYVLGIETSCDETSASVMFHDKILSNFIASQTNLHKQWGGIVPEAAARKHTEAITLCINEALLQADIQISQINAIAVTNRPGLIGSLSVGVTAAKTLSMSKQIPFLGIHHIEAHILSPLINQSVSFPHCCLIVSGGHTLIIKVNKVGNYQILGRTIDDAAGEALDKCARAIGLGYPGGPAIEQAAGGLTSSPYSLPRGLKGPTYDFSFSGLKTALRVLAEKHGKHLDVPSAAWSVEEAVTSVLSERAVAACKDSGCNSLTLAGGVAANKNLRNKLTKECDANNIQFIPAPNEFCTDNAAMIANVGSIRMANGQSDNLNLDVFARAELPTEEVDL